MRIGLISDTRVPGGAKEVPPEVASAFEGVELILHAGGIHVPSVLDWLEQIAPVMAVGRIHGGQAERPTPLALESFSDARVSELLVLPVEGHTIGMVNNLELDGFSDDILPGTLGSHTFADDALPRMVEEFFGAPADVVVFGRTLYALVEEHQGVLFVNPGSPTLPRNLMKLGNVALLELSPGECRATIIDLADYR
ncbi:MAG: metallophosphoesterase family protein [Chloroflexota bacterium]|nr:metallophosphoesterase family protein [Chloroflexota bacterium]MDE2941401.1 metallophosphoesterase family protein [Chloroflexota bacterium]MDE3268589.1 metallophosphoesterase family protein [Chloroflexota bacterium]